MIRKSILSFGIALCASISILSTATDAAEKKTRKPNVILIFADDLGYGDIQCYGGKVKTPNIDRLAAEGMRFDNAYLPASVCSPSRYSLLSGRYFWRNPRHPVKGVIGPSSPSAFNEGELTLQKMFRQKGYATSVFGKWHIGIGKKGADWGPFELEGGPLDYGFDTFFGTAANVENAPMIYIENRTFVGRRKGDEVRKVRRKDIPWKFNIVPWDESALYKDDEVAGEVNKYLVKYIENAPKNKPLFIYYPTHIPHKPITPHAKFAGKTKFGPYGDFLLELDTYVGDVVAALKKTGRLDNTLIIFTSDNGGLNPMNEEHARKWNMDPMWEAQEAGHIINGPLSDGKHSVKDGGFRVPFIARWPGRIPAGKTIDELICTTDVMATCAAILDYELPADAAVDSVDLLPLWTGKSAESRRDYVILDASDGTFAIRRGKWKYIEKNRGRGRPGSRENQLYDVEEDIGETRNLIAQHPEVVKELRKILDNERGQAKGINGVAYPRPAKAKKPAVKGKKPVKASDTGLIKNGKFEAERSGWRTWTHPKHGGAKWSFTKSEINGKSETAAVFTIGKAGDSFNWLQLMQNLPELKSGTEYTLSFKARMAKGDPAKVTTLIRKQKGNKAPMPGCTWTREIGKDWTDITVTFKATKMDSPPFITVGLGHVTGTIHLADFGLREKDK